ncbi:hypothetical protein COCVIDRAFT_37454 [Bipolaris victoriae FI3]|uniref:Uncharacterized protein n=1 Tax=Bipolaris victoriae (strain FI3) TaxID=930091 RepID=W7EKP8_BIPV3|nr:hypothetical protein COCVIDRAFT_37454 [Bipolaris victoriae FI3]
MPRMHPPNAPLFIIIIIIISICSHVCVCHPCKCLIRIHALLPAMSSPQSLSVSVDLSKVTYSPPDGVKRAVIGLAPVPTFDLLIDSCPWTISLPPPCQPPSLLKL